MRRLLPALLALFLLAPGALAQEAQDSGGVETTEGVRFTLTGIIQARASYGYSHGGTTDVERLGFGLRRARLRALAAFPSGAGLFMQFDGADANAFVLDFFGLYDLSDAWRLRLGRMTSAQPRGFIQTGIYHIDVADRAAIVERWGRMTLGGDGRDFGIDARYRRGGTEAILFVHNGDGSWDRVRGNFQTSISGGSATGGVSRRGMAVSGSVTHRLASVPGVEIGGFAGYNGAEGPNTGGRSYATYGAHAYLGALPGSRPLRLKLDLLGITYEEAGPGDDAQTVLGGSLLAAWRPKRCLELIGRAELFESDTSDDLDGDVYTTLAVTFSPSARRGDAFHRERLTLAWQRVDFGAGTAVEDLVFLQLQIGF